MHDASLHHRRRERALDGLGEPLSPSQQAVSENIAHAARLELVDHFEPELRAVILLNPQAQDFLAARLGKGIAGVQVDVVDATDVIGAFC